MTPLRARQVVVVLGGGETLMPTHTLPATALPHFGFALWEALFGTGSILLLTTLFRRHVTGDGPFARFLAGNAFAVYLLHAPVIVAVVALRAPLDLPSLAAFALVLVVTMVISWLLAALVRRVPAVRSVLRCWWASPSSQPGTLRRRSRPSVPQSSRRLVSEFDRRGSDAPSMNVIWATLAGSERFPRRKV